MLVTLVSLVSAVLWVVKEREKRLAAQQRALQAEHALASSPGAEDQLNAKRNEMLFEQHRRMNQLTIAKLESEVQLMQLQLQSKDSLKDREEAGKEYHELMVEKTKLEMDSLRLHIAELRKRMDDWSAD